MKRKLLLIAFIIASIHLGLYGQTHKVIREYKLTQNTVVKDSAGNVLPFDEWRKLLMSHQYGVKLDGADSTAYVLFRVANRGTQDMSDEMMKSLPKPPESSSFKLGEKISSFSASDINGNRIKLKELKGKVVVLNFWFIHCPACRYEIPSLNKIVAQYTSDPNVVFLAIALDERYELKDFLKDTPFNYQIVSHGQMYADLYKIRLFPTTVILDKEGLVRLHTAGFSPSSPYWMKKTIDEYK